MKLLIFITPHEFRDESLSTVKLFFDKWDISYSISSYSNKDCIGSHGGVCRTDINTGKAQADDFDGVVLVDGKGIEAYKIYDFRPLLDLMTKFNDRKKPIIAIENAIKIPARANIIKGRKIAAPDDQEAKRLIELFHGVPTEEAIEISDNLMSIRSHLELEGAMQTVIARLGVA
jgi:putative intracellular protease/amidase